MDEKITLTFSYGPDDVNENDDLIETYFDLDLSFEELKRLAKSYNQFIYMDLTEDADIADIATLARQAAEKAEEGRNGKKENISWLYYPQEFRNGLTILDMETNYLSAVERAAAISDMTDDQVVILYAFCETEEEKEWYGSFLKERGIKV